MKTYKEYWDAGEPFVEIYSFDVCDIIEPSTTTLHDTSKGYSINVPSKRDFNPRSIGMTLEELNAIIHPEETEFEPLRIDCKVPDCVICVTSNKSKVPYRQTQSNLDDTTCDDILCNVCDHQLSLDQNNERHIAYEGAHPKYLAICAHNYVLYQGLKEAYNYCTLCGIVEEKKYEQS